MSRRIDALLTTAIVWDNHSCMPLRPGDRDFLPQLQGVRDAGFSTVSLNIGCAEQTPEQHLKVLAWFRHWLKQRPDQYRLIESADDVVRARHEGKLGVFFDIEGARGIGDELSLVEMYKDLGVQWMLIAYNRRNLAGSGCYDTEDGGLTPFGRDMVAEMNRVGMTVCCSHTGERTAYQVLEASRRPVIFSHSNCATVHPHRRNISDAMIRACAAQGGVVGINGIGDFLSPPGGNLIAAYARHIDHAVQLVGPEHVGIAIDYLYDRQELADILATMKESFPEPMQAEFRMVEPGDLRAILAELIALGYDDEALRLILGGAWLRVARATWQ